MNNQDYIQEQEEVSIKFGIKKYMDELVAEEVKRASDVTIPDEKICDKRVKRKVYGSRKVRKLVVLVAVLVAVLLTVGISVGAFGNLWDWLTAQIANSSLTFQDSGSYAEVDTADGIPASEIYAQTATQFPDINLVVPGWLPEGAVLEYHPGNQYISTVDLMYNFEGGYISINMQAADNYVSSTFPLQGNEYDVSTIEVMGQQAQYTRIINELGKTLYVVVWKDSAGTTCYTLSVASDNVEVFNKTMQKIQVYQ